MKMSKKFKSEEELPDCVISYIFSKLCLKDLVKTSVLSKRWLHEWRSRIDLNFDLHNMFDYNTLQELPQNLPVPLLKTFQSEFATRMDRFMLKHRGDMIRSLRVDFPLGNQHSDVIDKMIFKGIAKGVERIELLFSYQNNSDFEIEPYKFVFELLSLDDSLTYLHLQKCHLVAPINLSGFNNLRTLVLHLVVVKQDLLQGMLSSCIHLVDFTLNDCEFNSDLKIISPKLFNLNIVNCGVEIGREKNIDIFASNLSSIEYSCNGREVHSMNIKADMLSKFSYRGREISQHIGFSGLKNVTTIVFDGLHECISDDIVPHLFSECLQLEDVTFKNCWMICRMKIISPKLRRLSIIDCCYDGMSPYRMSIDALNLSSFEYSGYTRVFSVNAPRLSKVFWNATTREETPFAIHPYESLLYIENLTMIMSTSQVSREINGDIAMASHHLEKLSVTIENSHMIGLQRKRREYAGFFHNDLKYVELHGCVCTINVIELASHLLRNAYSLKKITFSSLDKFYMGAGRWTKGSNVCCWGFKRNFIHEMLKDDVNEHCQLTIV
ncbi:putative F-box domain, FBD domain, leucine-rich repeat domain, L domain-containing protein [Medicago truncatula]|uniref:Putative F-box domain, FBD domain, leucine-rich repeat domain, L domain-containing protein n=1 Tax=Medicago truncatula TaxID=3880 RepID=A0A396H458_MEDTR|nr:putative F-box domain, FBD domain, leucine-rich repeat domain, L domain-containing protein [Medicago truncatula]